MTDIKFPYQISYEIYRIGINDDELIDLYIDLRRYTFDGKKELTSTDSNINNILKKIYGLLDLLINDFEFNEEMISIYNFEWTDISLKYIFELLLKLKESPDI
jgi:hypothetical protein